MLPWRCTLIRNEPATWDWKPRVKPEVTSLSENPVIWCSPVVCVSVCSCVWRPLPVHQHWLCVWREEPSIRRRRRSQSSQCLWTQQTGGREGDTETLSRYLSVSLLSHPHLSVSLPPICPSLVCLSLTSLCCSCADPAGANSVRGGGVCAGERRHLSVAPCPGHDGKLHFGPLSAEVPHRHPGRSRCLQEAVWEGETGRLRCVWEGDGSLFPPACLTACLSLLQDPSIRGVFHFSSKQQMTKYEMGVSMAQAFNLSCDHLIPVNIYIINMLMGCCILIVVTTFLNLMQSSYGLFIYEQIHHDTWGDRKILQINLYFKYLFFFFYLGRSYAGVTIFLFRLSDLVTDQCEFFSGGWKMHKSKITLFLQYKYNTTRHRNIFKNKKMCILYVFLSKCTLRST